LLTFGAGKLLFLGIFLNNYAFVSNGSNVEIELKFLLSILLIQSSLFIKSSFISWYEFMRILPSCVGFEKFMLTAFSLLRVDTYTDSMWAKLEIFLDMFWFRNRSN